MAWPLTTGTRSTPKALPVMAAPLPRIRPRSVPLPTSCTSLIAASGVAELGEARLHRYGDRRAHLDGVDAVVVIQKIHHGDLVHVADAAVPAVGPDGLVTRAAW